jgi:hypothetical protein
MPNAALDPLRPLPLSAAAVADLVARVRARPDFQPFRLWIQRRARKARPPCRSALAATYAFEVGVSLTALAVVLAAIIGLGVASACFGEGCVVEERVRLDAIARDLALMRELLAVEHH